MNAYEQLGQFYLGKPYDLEARQPREPWLLYDSKDLTTHAVCVGMTGSGKTGLCLALLEEAAIDGVPAIAIDPKGDLGNLMLTFPELRSEDFRPWLDAAEAERQGVSLDELAAATAAKWRDGLAAWDEDGERIARFRQSADVAIYTPGSSAGLPLALLRSFAAPADRGDSDAMRERITSTVSGLLALLGIEADPVRSRDHMLLAMILDHAWRAGRDVDLAGLIRDIQSPPFDRVGLVDLEAFYPAKDRFGLAMSLNNLLAHPSFSAWMQGEPLDVERLLHTRDGRPRLSIISIAHLGDAERMFFVTLLLNECVAWMRRQSGTASLRAILYMDEIFGYFPPTASPPSKTPLLTLMKQARAFGLGVVLATQNPVDLDYKGLSNAGTWFLGRLQTERDKARVLDGLEGASAAAGAAFDRRKTEATLSSLGSRVFLMNNVHEDEPLVFQTRWTLSYLRGPLARDQIASLMAERREADAAARGAAAPADRTDAARADSPADSAAAATAAPGAPSASAAATARPVLSPGVVECFVRAHAAPRDGERLVYRPALLGSARVHFVQSKVDLDAWETATLLASDVSASLGDIWDRAACYAESALECDGQPIASATFDELPAALRSAKTYAQLDKSLKDCLYRTRAAKLWKNAALKQVSRHGESEGDFRARLIHAAHEARDQQLEKLRVKYAPKMASLDDQIRRALERVDRERSQATQQSVQTMVSVGQSILSAVLGRKLASSANVGRAATSVRSASRAARERADIQRAEQAVEALRQKRTDLEAAFQKDVAKVQTQMSAERLEIEPLEVRARKSEITTSGVTLAWTPWIVDAAGMARPAFARAKD